MNSNGEQSMTELKCPLLLDKDQTAAVLNVPPATIENLHRARLLRGCLVGKHLRWRPSDVREYVDSLEAGND